MSLFLLVLSLLLWPLQSGAYFGLTDTGELRQGSESRLLIGAQQILDSHNEGFNINGRYIMDSSGFIKGSEVQMEAGSGSIDYHIGVFLKWIPFPDTDDQPAVGLRTGFRFASLEYSTYGFSITPLISDSFNSGIGRITPYCGLPLGLQQNTLESIFSTQVAIGIEWSPQKWELGSSRGFHFILEYDMNINKAFDSVHAALAYDFE